MHYAVHVYSTYTYMYIGAGVSWVSSTARFTYQLYKPRPKPTPTTQPPTTQLPTTQLPTTSPDTCPGMPGTRHPLVISHTLAVADTLTHNTCTAGALMHSLHPLQILVITNFLSVAMFQTQYVHLSILFTTSSRTAAVGAPPPVLVLMYLYFNSPSLLASVGLLKYINRHPSSWSLAPAVLDARRDNQVSMQ